MLSIFQFGLIHLKNTDLSMTSYHGRHQVMEWYFNFKINDEPADFLIDLWGIITT